MLALCLSHVTKIPLFFSRVPSSSWLGCELAWLLQRSHVHEVLWVCAAGTDEAKGFFWLSPVFLSPSTAPRLFFSWGFGNVFVLMARLESAWPLEMLPGSSSGR